MKRRRNQANTQTLTIASGAALSGELEFSPYDKLIIHMPAAWTAADIGFQVSNGSGGTFLPLYDAAGARVEYTPVVSTAALAPAGLAGAYWLKLWSQTGGVSVNQAAERTIEVTVKS
jgi:hypothetical protein